MLFFFFKQKTAFEMLISDWSSDVCSSDLLAPRDWRQLTHSPLGGLDKTSSVTGEYFSTVRLPIAAMLISALEAARLISVSRPNIAMPFSAPVSAFLEFGFEGEDGATCSDFMVFGHRSDARSSGQEWCITYGHRGYPSQQ